VVASFDDTMKQALPEPAVASTWNGLVAQVGKFQSVEQTNVVRSDKHTTVVLTCKFERARLDAKVAYDASGKVAGLFFAPAVAPYDDPPYVDRKTFVERDVTVGTGDWAVPGTLALPRGAGPFRAVVLVHGSGPHDRDASLGANRPFKDLAGGLASRGIAVLRYEKRTKAHGAKFAAVPEATLDHETVDDAIAAVELLRNTREIDAAHVVVAGHSLGGFAAPRIAARDNRIAGIAILAGSTRWLTDMMIEQMQYIATVDDRQAAAMPAAIEQVKAAASRVAELVKGATPKPGEMVLGAGAAYWIDLAKYDALATAKKLTLPMFVAQGGRDYQVTEVDYRAWQKALAGNQRVAFKLYPELDHILAAGTGKCGPQDYEQRRPVDVRLVDDLATWIRAL
jgi:dienelactone hydrolase